MKKAASDPSPAKPQKKSNSEAAAKADKPPAPKKKTAAKKSPASPSVPDAFVPAAAAATEASTSLTVVAARVDIGFGNILYVRGTGPGLSWDAGTPMINAGSDLWTIDLIGARGPVYCKFLINDEKWSAGPDYVIEPGAQLEVTPLF
jgi:hypothetical protein